MPLQDISPINDQLADIIVRADEPWIESSPGQAWMKVLWVGPETTMGCSLPLEEGLRGLAPQTPLGRPHLCAKGAA